MLLFYRYPKRILAVLAVVLAVEYAIVHRISLDALTRSDVGLSQWRQLLTDCNCNDCEVRHLTLIHDGLYQRAYSVHLLHRVLAISSEDGDPYDAFDDDDDVDGEATDAEDTDDGEATGLVPLHPDGASVPYAYAPGDMLSKSLAPPHAALQVAGSRPSHPATTAPSGVPALPSMAVSVTAPEAHHPSNQQGQEPPTIPSRPAEQEPTPQQHQHQQRVPGGVPGVVGAAAAADGAATSGSPRLLQAVVWQPSKVLSVFPWQLRAHFFLSLASTRMYLLMGLWPRAAAVAAAAPRRLRQAPSANAHSHNHHPQQQQQRGGGATTSPDAMAAGAGAGAGARTGGVPQPPSSGGASVSDHATASSPPQPQGYAGGGGAAGGGAGGSGYSHPHATAQATAHAYAQHAHGYDGMSGLYGLGRSATDESQSLAAALSALGRGVPVFLPPEMLVEHGVQEDLMASCVFKPAVKYATASGTATTGSGGDGGFSGTGAPLTRWRTWPSRLSRWVADLALRIKLHGGRAAARLRAAGGAAGVLPPLPPGRADGPNGGIGDATGLRRGTEQQQRQGAAGDGVQQQQHTYAYVECRLYRTDRARNASFTCPAVLTVLPSPPRGSRASHHHLPHTLYQQHQPPQPHQAPAPGGSNGSAAAAATTCPGAGGAGACPAGNATAPGAGAAPPQLPQQPQQPSQAQPNTAHSSRPRSKPRLLRRLWLDLRYMAYGVVMPYKWAPILAGILSPHMFLLACLPAFQSLGLMGPFTARLCAYHAVCIVLTAADHLLLLRLASELWLRARPERGQPGGHNWQRWLALARWLFVDGFLASGWLFRAVVMGILATKQMELWNHLYGASFRPHPLLYCFMVLPAGWMTSCATCSAAWRLTSGHHAASAPLLLFQEGFLSGLSSPLYSLVYISFAVLGLGGGGVGGGAGGVLGLAAANSRLPLWLLDAVVVSPLLTVVTLDVLWNMDAAARATPLLMVIVNALRCHQLPEDAAGGALGRRGRGRLGGGGGGGVPGWLPPRAAAIREGPPGAVKQHTSLWMLLETSRWWAHHVRAALEEEQQQLQEAQQMGAQGLVGDAGAAAAAAAAAAAGERGMREQAAAAVARVALAARHAGMMELPRRVIAGMMAAYLLPLPGELWPPQREQGARAVDLLLEAAAEAGPVPRRRGGAGGGAGGPGDRGAEEEEDLELDEVDLELLGLQGPGGAAGAAGGGEQRAEEGDGGERMVRAPDGSLRPLSALEAELRAGLAQVAALRAQLAAVGRGVADLLLLGRWPPPLELPPEALAWCESVPHGFLCPITHSLMTQPALLVSPQLSEASPTYELSAIREWLRSNRTDPTTGRYLHTYHFIHNDNLRKAIEDWVADRLAREQQQQQDQQQNQQQEGQHEPQLRQRQRQRYISPARRQGPGGDGLSPPRGGLLQASAAAAAAAAGGAAGGRYQPVAGPGLGQRSVCVGTSEMGLRMQSPERFRGGVGAVDGGGRAGRSRSRGRPRSRGGALRPAGATVMEGLGGTAAAVLARQLVQRAASRQRGRTELQ